MINDWQSLAQLGVQKSLAGDKDGARTIFEKVSRLNPDYLPLRIMLAASCYENHEYQKAIKHLKACLKINPSLSGVHSLLYLAYKSACLWENADKLTKILDDETHEDPLVSLIRSENPLRNLQVAQKTAQIISASVPKNLFEHKISFPKKIRLGYLSGDFYNHATSHLLFLMFALHDRRKFEIYVYSYGPNDHSLWRQKVEKGADKFMDFFGRSDLELANAIYKDQINILTDLKGYTTNARLGVCAMRPAPVQAAYLGFPGSTGADFFDYAMVDEIVVPPQEESYFSEKLVYLQDCYQMNEPFQALNTKCRRSDFGLPETGVVFSSFNQSFKFDPVMFTTWTEILKSVPESVLWMWNMGQETCTNLKKFVSNLGLDPDRLVFSPTLERPLHLVRLQLADLALDTRIYNGHTTTSDNLRAGVPVVTLKGTHFASRVAASILITYGIPELVTNNLEEYKNLAIDLAKNPKKLNAIHSILNVKRKGNPLFDTEKTVKNIEKSYKIMWQNYLSDRKPTKIVL